MSLDIDKLIYDLEQFKTCECFSSKIEEILEHESRRILIKVLIDKLKAGYTLQEPLDWERRIIKDLYGSNVHM